MHKSESKINNSIIEVDSPSKITCSSAEIKILPTACNNNDENVTSNNNNTTTSSNGCVTFLSPDSPCSSSSSGHHAIRKQEGRHRTHSELSNSSSSGAGSSASSADFTVTPPDGGWGWVVVFASFITYMIADGVTFSFGVLYVDFLQHFKASKSKTAWVGSLFMGVPLLAGPIASTLTDRFGCRRVTIAGALLASAGFVLSSMANSLEILFFTFGIMSGLGLALCYVAAIVIVAYYFEKRRALATGLSVCGSGIGTFIFAPFIRYLVEKYAWRGATLILAGCFLNIVVCGALMRDLEGTVNRKVRSEKSLKTTTSSESLSQSQKSSAATAVNSEDAAKKVPLLEQHRITENRDVKEDVEGDIPEDLKDYERLCNSLVQLPTFIQQGAILPKELIEKMGRQGINYEYFIENYPHLLISSASEHELPITESQAVTTTYNSMSNGCLGPLRSSRSAATRRLSSAYFHNLRLHRRSMTHRNAMLNVHRYHIRASSCPDIYRNSMITIAQEEEDEICSFLSDLKEALMDMVDISYFKNLKFLLFSVSNLLLYTWYDVPYVYMTDNAIEMGVDEDSASYLISLIGILNTLGELMFGIIGDQPWANTTLLYSISIALCGAVITLVPLINSFTGWAFVASSFGFTISANYALTSIILVDLITLEWFTNAYGLLLLVQGVANLIGPPLAGWLYDMSGSYDLSFYMAGLWIFLAGAMLLVLPLLRWFQRLMSRRSSRQTNGVGGNRKTGNLSKEAANHFIKYNNYKDKAHKETIL